MIAREALAHASAAVGSWAGGLWPDPVPLNQEISAPGVLALTGIALYYTERSRLPFGRELHAPSMSLTLLPLSILLFSDPSVWVPVVATLACAAAVTTTGSPSRASVREVGEMALTAMTSYLVLLCVAAVNAADESDLVPVIAFALTFKAIRAALRYRRWPPNPPPGWVRTGWVGANLGAAVALPLLASELLTLFAFRPAVALVLALLIVLAASQWIRAWRRHTRRLMVATTSQAFPTTMSSFYEALGVGLACCAMRTFIRPWIEPAHRKPAPSDQRRARPTHTTFEVVIQPPGSSPCTVLTVHAPLEKIAALGPLRPQADAEVTMQAALQCRQIVLSHAQFNSHFPTWAARAADASGQVQEGRTDSGSPALLFGASHHKGLLLAVRVPLCDRQPWEYRRRVGVAAAEMLAWLDVLAHRDEVVSAHSLVRLESDRLVAMIAAGAAPRARSAQLQAIASAALAGTSPRSTPRSPIETAPPSLGRAPLPHPDMMTVTAPVTMPDGPPDSRPGNSPGASAGPDVAKGSSAPVPLGKQVAVGQYGGRRKDP